MFVHQHQLEHVLPASDYWRPERHSVEGERLFRPAWHPVAVQGELPRSGDFKTLSLLGTPVLIQNFGGALSVFLNVCAHRHAMLSHVARGHCDALRCQYHGWEYQADGSTAHIPEAKLFRPWDRESARLTTIRSQWCGGVLFATLDADPEPLEEYLGPFHAQCPDWFDDRFRFARHWSSESPSNWKVLVENAIESYHVPMVHPTSFGVAPAEEICRHQLEPRWTRFESDETLAWRQRGQTLLTRILGLEATNVYVHHLVYPGLQFIRTDMVRIVIHVTPTAPTSALQRVWVFGPHGTRRSPLASVLRGIMKRVVVFETHRVLNEDAAILADVQRGLQASPHRGVIGTREERVFAFQQYVQTAAAAHAASEPHREPIAGP